jgi:hypothetical protein
MIMILEGAFVLSRAGRDPEPVLTAGRSMIALARAAIEEGRTAGSPPGAPERGCQGRGQ